MKTIQVDDSGAIIEPPIGEMFAIGLADGLTIEDAWFHTHAGQAPRKLLLRDELLASDVFKTRVEYLKIDRDLTLADKTFGEAIWMLNQGFRLAFARRDLGAMKEFSNLRLQAANSQARLRERLLAERKETQPEPNGAETPRSVGKPSEKNPQSTRDMSQIKKALMERNVPVAAPEEDAA